MSDQWFYDMNGQASAPVTKAMLGQMLASGQINRQTQVIRDGIQWTPLENVAELRDICATAPPPVDADDLAYQGFEAFNAGDYAKAVELWRMAADMGHVGAQYGLALRYYYGQGVEKDFYKAVELWRKIADQDARAQNCLGDCYKLGEGVTKDYAQAVEWYRKAADQGDDTAQYNLGNCYYYGDGVAKDFDKAVELYRKAAAQGNATARDYLDKLKAEGKI